MTQSTQGGMRRRCPPLFARSEGESCSGDMGKKKKQKQAQDNGQAGGAGVYVRVRASQ